MLFDKGREYRKHCVALLPTEIQNDSTGQVYKL